MILQPGDERYLDGDGKPSVPLGLLLILLILLRGYAAWIVSMTFADDRSKLLGFFYTNVEQFALALLVGLPAILVLVLTFLLRPGCSELVLACWRKMGWLLWLAWLADGVLLASLVVANWPTFSPIKAGLIMLWCWTGWYLFKSRHLQRYRVLLADYCS